MGACGPELDDMNAVITAGRPSWRHEYSAICAQRTAYGALRIVALRDSRRPGLAAAGGQTRWPPARRVSRHRAHTHPKHRRTAPKVIAAWRGSAVAGGRRRARFAVRSAAARQWPSAWRGGSVAFPGHMALFADDIRLAEPGRRCVHDLACATSRSGPGWRCHGDHRTPPTRFDLPGREDPVYIAAQRWALEPWEGEDPPSLAKIWSRKPKFAVNGSRSCAELAIVRHLRDQRWHGVWVNSFGSRELRSASYRAGQRSCMT